MRVLFLDSNPMWIHGLPNGFLDVGHDVKISGALTQENLPNIISEFNPDLIFTVGWGPENSSLEKQDLIHQYTKASGIPHIYWATEDPTHTKYFTLPFLKRVQPDFIFTICPDNVEYYQKLGIEAAHLDFGYHSYVHHPLDSCKTYKSTIAIVANAYPKILQSNPQHYRIQSLKILIQPLLQNNIRIDFYGRHWEDMQPFLGLDIPEEWIHGYLHYTEANKVYSSADIIIGLQNHPTQLTQRTYEILASGGFLLTNDTLEINRLFNPGQNLIVSSSPEETLRLIRYYLIHPEQRQLIRAQAIAAVANHSYQHRAEHILRVLQEHKIFERKVSNYDMNAIDEELHYEQDCDLYTVCNGDTLWQISRKFGISIDRIMKINEMNSDMIYAGQLLKLQGITTPSLKPGSSLLISKGDTNNNLIALTYDAGSEAEGTHAILEVLKKHAVKATFFLTGEWVENYPYLARRIVEDGHELGNHSYRHPDLTELTPREIIDELTQAEETIYKITGWDCRPLFRPPYGAWNREVLEAAGKCGYRFSIYWSLDTIDWQHPGVELIVKRIMEKVESDDIILMHLGLLATATASDIIIPWLKAHGFSLVPVSKILENLKPAINPLDNSK